MKKKLLAILLIATMIVSLAACSKDTKESTDSKKTQSTSSTTSSNTEKKETEQKTEQKETNSNDQAQTETANQGFKGQIVVGCIQDLSGTTSVLGNMVNNGVTIAVDELNANGGINGYEIKLITYDTKADVKEAINAYNRLCEQDKASVVIGPPVSNIALALAPITQEKKVPIVSLAGDPAVYKDDSGATQPYMFLAQPSNEQYGELMASYAINELKVTKLALLYNQSNSYSVSNANAFKAYVESHGGSIVAEETYIAGDSDFSSQFNNVMNSGAEAVFMPNYTQENVLAVQQKYLVGLEIPILGALDHLPPLASLVDNDDAADNIYCANNISMNDESLAYVKELYRNLTGEDPINKVFLGWDCVHILKAAAESAGSIDPADIRDGLENNIKNLALTTGTFTMNSATHLPEGLSMVMYKIEKGEYVELGRYTPVK